MGSRSDVKILMGLKGFELLKQVCESHEEDFVRAMTLNPDTLTIDEEAGAVLIGWSYVNWRINFKDTGTVECVLSELSNLVESDPEQYPLEDYFYKKIQIGEDCAVEEDTNDDDEEYTSNFYVICKFSL